jgi:hypothetical protein
LQLRSSCPVLVPEELGRSGKLEKYIRDNILHYRQTDSGMEGTQPPRSTAAPTVIDLSAPPAGVTYPAQVSLMLPPQPARGLATIDATMVTDACKQTAGAVEVALASAADVPAPLGEQLLTARHFSQASCRLSASQHTFHRVLRDVYVVVSSKILTFVLRRPPP